MRLDRRLLDWGVFFILLGAVPLAVRANVVEPGLVSRWPTLWPVLLIGWGVGLVLRGTPGHWLGGAVTAITLGLMGGGAIATGFAGMPSFAGCGAGSGGTAFQARQGTFADTGRIEIEFNCGSLAVSTADGSGWQVSGTDTDGAGPEISTDSNGAVSLKGRERGFNFGNARSTWDVILPRTPSLQAGVTLNAGDGSIDLEGANVGGFNLTVNAGSVTANLATAEALPHDGLNVTVNAGKASVALPTFDGTADLSLNAGSLEVCVPSGTAIQVHWNGTIASNDLDESGLHDVGDSTWQSAGFDAAPIHVELDVSANAGSFSLQLGGSCGA
jgi:hypothetical protein